MTDQEAKRLLKDMMDRGHRSSLSALLRLTSRTRSSIITTYANGQWWMAANLMPFDEWKARQCKSK